MKLIKEKTNDFYLLDTRVENIFISEYMPGAPDAFVKVYLYGAMYAEHGLALSIRTVAKQLAVPEETVRAAWDYWEKLGVVRIQTEPQDDDDLAVTFIHLKELLYGKHRAAQTEPAEAPRDDRFDNKAVRQMFADVEQTLGRTLSSSEMTRMLSWLSDYGVTPEVIRFAVQYAAERDKRSLHYIETVAVNWTREGLTTAAQVQKKLQEEDERYYRYRRVLKALGFTRNATEAERAMMDTWFDDMGYTMDRVLEACNKTAGISSPNFNYVNRVLENWAHDAERKGVNVNQKQVVTQAVLNQYYEALREKAEQAAEARRQEVYAKLPRIRELDEEIRKVSAQLSKTLLMGNAEKESRKISVLMDELSAERAVILTEHNYEIDYTDIKYACEKCKDTGITDLGERCSCIRMRTEEAEVWMKEKYAKNLPTQQQI